MEDCSTKQKEWEWRRYQRTVRRVKRRQRLFDLKDRIKRLFVKDKGIENMYFTKEMVLYTLSQRANIQVRNLTIKDKSLTVVIYDDHRTLLNVLYFLRMKKLLNESVNLIFFDYHDDALQPNRKVLSKLHRISISEKCFRDFWNVIEFDLSHEDDDWLWAGMDCGLIKHAFRVAGKEDTNIKKLNEAFKGKHIMVPLEWDDIKGFVDEYSKLPEDKNIPFVLDFDLDCFSTDESPLGRQQAWSDSDFENHFEKNPTTVIALKELIRYAEIITICREPGCCGGIGESNKILHCLDQYLFEGKLQA